MGVRLAAGRFSRRSLLTAGGLAAVAAVVPGSAALRVQPAADPYQPVSRRQYADAVGTSFRVHVDATRTETVVLEQLIEARPARGSTPPTPQHDAFHLLFRGPGQSALTQGTYTMDHDTLGTTMLLLVPAGSHAGGGAHLATINRL